MDTEKVGTRTAHSDVYSVHLAQDSARMGKINETQKDKYFMFMIVCGVYIEKRPENKRVIGKRTVTEGQKLICSSDI